MQDKDQLAQQNHENTVSPSLRTQRILDFLEKQLERTHEPSHDDFRNIIESVLGDPEVYRTTGLSAIADHFVSGMELHLLSLVAIFKKKALQEGISPKEYQTTLDDVLPMVFNTIEILRKQVSIRSLDALVALYNITIKLYTLSSVKTAETAQRWLYELPATYTRRLENAGMLLDERNGIKKANGNLPGSNRPFTQWEPSYSLNNEQKTQETRTTPITFSTLEETSEPMLVKIETKNPNFGSAA